jgi:hypothetical protein
MDSQKIVIPVQAGIQTLHNQLKTLGSRFHGNDEIRISVTFCESIEHNPNENYRR